MMFLPNQQVKTTVDGMTWHGHVIADDGGTHITCFLESWGMRIRGTYEILRSQVAISPRYAATPCPHCGRCPEED